MIAGVKLAWSSFLVDRRAGAERVLDLAALHQALVLDRLSGDGEVLALAALDGFEVFAGLRTERVLLADDFDLVSASLARPTVEDLLRQVGAGQSCDGLQMVSPLEGKFFPE